MGTDGGVLSLLAPSASPGFAPPRTQRPIAAKLPQTRQIDVPGLGCARLQRCAAFPLPVPAHDFAPLAHASAARFRNALLPGLPPPLPGTVVPRIRWRQPEIPTGYRPVPAWR